MILKISKQNQIIFRYVSLAATIIIREISLHKLKHRYCKNCLNKQLNQEDNFYSTGVLAYEVKFP